jgi:hypothetical protein
LDVAVKKGLGLGIRLERGVACNAREGERFPDIDHEDEDEFEYDYWIVPRSIGSVPYPRVVRPRIRISVVLAASLSR